jgi:hypothetical protein
MTWTSYSSSPACSFFEYFDCFLKTKVLDCQIFLKNSNFRIFGEK